jgi:hypothetical protein
LRHFIAAILASGLLTAQVPRVGIVDFYGARKTPAAELRRTAAVKEGDPLPASKVELEEKLEALEHVVRAEVSAACCDQGRAILYIGVEEKGSPHFDTRNRPEGTAELPEEIARTYMQFIAAVGNAAEAGRAGEDLTQGHSLMSDPKARALQERFVDLASANLAQLRAVLKEGADNEQRAMAAYVIGYAPKKAEIVDDLLYALKDPDETVRANAMRNLGALAVYARKDPARKLRLQPTWIIELLNAIAWSDRHNAAVTLVTLTESREPGTLDLLRERAIDSLVDMAGWKHLPHALPGYILLGRVAGLSEEELQSTWSAGKRESVIRRFRTRP